MNKTKIEWCDYTINPVKGLCPMACPYCYARAMYKRFKWNPIIRYDDWVWHDGCNIPRGSKTFVGSTMELFGDWVKPEWLELIFQYCESASAHTFIFLTKLPENLYKWSPFPKNCWIGVSASDNNMAWAGSSWLKHIEASVKFISLEPLLKPLHSDDGKLDFTRAVIEELDWVIIGQQTPVKLSTMPQIGWVEEIVNACDKAHIPVFLKDNLISCVDQYPFAFSGEFPDIKLRQEFPAPNKEKE